jgi:F-type H+-transporting ATPase subunit gamma
MLARTALRPALVAQPMITASQARNMATLREIELRLKSVRNIEKITKVRFAASKSVGRNG